MELYASLAVLLTVVGLGSTEERLGSVHHVLCGDGLLDAHLAERRGPQGRRPTEESPRTCVTLVDGCVRPCTYAYVEVTLVRNVNMSSGGSKGGCGTMRWMDRWRDGRSVGRGPRSPLLARNAAVIIEVPAGSK